MEYLLYHGNERIIQDVKDYHTKIRRITTYKYYEGGSRDIAGPVRSQAQKILQVIGNMEQLKRKREEYSKTRKNYEGFGNKNMPTKIANTNKTSNTWQRAAVGDDGIRTVHKWSDTPVNNKTDKIVTENIKFEMDPEGKPKSIVTDTDKKANEKDPFASSDDPFADNKVDSNDPFA
eukprot:UN31055